MAYTPIGWQTGDTITAEKLNKMDNGWSVEVTKQVCFDGTVTTSEMYGYNTGHITTESAIAVDTVIVTFNGTEYECPNVSSEGGYEYGAPYSESYDFSTFPFNIYVEPGSRETTISTENAGTYTMKIEAAEEKTEVSDAFKEVVDLCIDVPRILRCVENVTERADAQDCINNGGIVYCIVTDSRDGSTRLYFITKVSTTCSILPESTTIEAKFGMDDGLFYINYI